MGQEMATHPQDTHHFTVLPKAGESKLTGPGQEKKKFAQSWVLKQEILGARNEDKTDTSDGNLPALEALELMSVVEVKERLRARPSRGGTVPYLQPWGVGSPHGREQPPLLVLGEVLVADVVRVPSPPRKHPGQLQHQVVLGGRETQSCQAGDSQPGW